MAKASGIIPNTEDTTVDSILQGAVVDIYRKYGDTVRIDGESYTAFGKGSITTAASATTEFPLNDSFRIFGEPSIAAGNAFSSISSSSNGDTSPDNVEYEGVRLVNDKIVRFKDTATLAGQTKTALPTDAFRIYRAKFSPTSNTLSVGDIYLYKSSAPVTAGVPVADIYMAITIPNSSLGNDAGTSFKCAVSTPSDEYFVITGINVINEDATATVRHTWMLSQTSMRTFARTNLLYGTLNGYQTYDRQLTPPLIVPPEHDISIYVTAASANPAVTASFSGYWAKLV